MNTLALSSSLYENMYGIKISMTPELNNKIDYGGATRANSSKGGLVSTTDEISYAARYASDKIDDMAKLLDEICNLTVGINLKKICIDLVDLSIGVVNCDSVLNVLWNVKSMSSKLRGLLEDGLSPIGDVLNAAIDLLGSSSNALNVFYDCFEPSENSILGKIYGMARDIVDTLSGVASIGSEVLNSVYALIGNIDGFIQDSADGLMADINIGLDLINSTIGSLCEDILMNPDNPFSPLGALASYRQTVNPLINF